MVDVKSNVSKLFIGSSVEYLKSLMQYKKGYCIQISQSMYGLKTASDHQISHYLHWKEAENSDFALFLFGCEDMVVSRDIESLAPRDNIIFELGLLLENCLQSECILRKS